MGKRLADTKGKTDYIIVTLFILNIQRPIRYFMSTITNKPGGLGRYQVVQRLRKLLILQHGKAALVRPFRYYVNF